MRLPCVCVCVRASERASFKTVVGALLLQYHNTTSLSHSHQSYIDRHDTILFDVLFVENGVLHLRGTRRVTTSVVSQKTQQYARSACDAFTVLFILLAHDPSRIPSTSHALTEPVFCSKSKHAWRLVAASRQSVSCRVPPYVG